ncbi:metallophosphoesterase [Prosthecodimorpha staleyi]|uniref:Metallophosphoesterase n=1 Tax=Prosthecodimorpha staleyi TaxID=2840188 RepID=A0A947D144_9HYPH|nr:metallophosphoesterase [Prosthecodimorpha staleyi]MBT9288414.1 metallophosphoesterase [Prosthecodimorpha staleyi]
MLTRRTFLKTAAAGGMAFVGLGGYAFGLEPQVLLNVTRYDLALPRWRGAKPLTVALVADIHAVDPWMSTRRIAEIVEATNRLKPDLVLLLGDYVGTMRFSHGPLLPSVWAPILGDLAAPLGTYAILGNHDWWWSGGPTPIRSALERSRIPVLVNDAVRIERDGHRFWLSGTDSMVALHGPRGFIGKHDLGRALGRVTDDAPVIHMAHEPDLFVSMPERVALTVSGHTHGGQVRVPFVGAVVVPSAYGRRFAYGHIVEGGRHLVVSGGLGCSGLPVRFMAPPEIVLLTIHSDGITPQTPGLSS